MKVLVLGSTGTVGRDHVAQEEHVLRVASIGRSYVQRRTQTASARATTGMGSRVLKGLKLKISPADVADFVLTQLADKT
jgi:hypothetical protein